MPIAHTFEQKNVKKRCFTCAQTLPVASFQFKKKSENLRQAHCRDCRTKLDKAQRPSALARERAWALANPERAKAKHHRENLRKHYALSPEDYTGMLSAQNGRCAICRSDSPGRKNGRNFDVDHCHSTKTVRGLLCHSCNLGIGHLKDDPSLLEAALDVGYIAPWEVRAWTTSRRPFWRARSMGVLPS